MTDPTTTVHVDISVIYERALRSFPPDEQRLIKSTLSRWFESDDIGRIVVPNLTERERFLPEACMESILKAVLDTVHLDLHKTVKAFQSECYNHVRQGGEVQENTDFPRPLVLGRAIERAPYAKWLHGNFPRIFHDLDDADEFIVRLIFGTPLSPTEQALSMNVHGAWVTWMPREVLKDPFAFALHGVADEVRACLGLDPKGDGDLLLLVYESDSLDLFRPTVADANLFNYFEPPPKDFTLHGWTRPWQADFLMLRPSATHLPKEYRPQPRPEAIHPSVQFSKIKAPVRRLS